MKKTDCYEKRTGTKTIITERLVLRKILPADYFSTVKWYTDPAISKFALSRKSPGRWDVFKFTFGRLIKYFNKSYYNWAIVYNGKMHGFIELQPISNNDNAFSLRYKLDMSINGKGIMTEALKAVIGYSKTQGFLGLIGICDIDNIASKRVMEKSGMTECDSPETNNLIKYDDGTTSKALKYKIRFQLK